MNLDSIILELSVIIVGAALVPFKAATFHLAFCTSGESRKLARELAVRLSQSSEFSLLVAFTALSLGAISAKESMVIQITTIVTFIVSTYWTVSRYPTPISMNTELRKD